MEGWVMGEKKHLPGNTPMLVLKLLEDREMYGWEIINELAEKSLDTFKLKTGALYPVLHGLENDGYVTSVTRTIANGRVRKYYCITDGGRGFLAEKRDAWVAYSKAVDNILFEGMCHAT
jgi:PadR family transcriptional regulator PadR